MISTSFTWKDEYLLPYESHWSYMAKLCFLNGLTWSSVRRSATLKKFIRWPRLSNISMHPPGKSIESVNQKNNFGLQTQYNVYKICPVCMNYGYHSILHEIECIDYCVFHKCNLIKINHKQFDESRFGTYEFWNVKTENIVNNSCLADEIVKFKQKQEKERSIFNKYFFVQSGVSGKCYESTERLYQRLGLLQDDIVLYGCQCIISVSMEDIRQKNTELTEYIINCYVKSVEEKDYHYLDLHEYDIRQFTIEHCVRTSAQGELILRDHLLGWCFITVLWEAIKEVFNGIDDWDITFQTLCSYADMNIDSQQKMMKLAIILATQAITGVLSPEIIQWYNSWSWTRGKQRSNCNIPIFLELGQIAFMGGNYTRQLIVYSIIKNLFHTLVDQAFNLLHQNIDSVDKQFIQRLIYDLWIIPQYAVFYYEDRIDIYKCGPELGE